MNLLEDEPIKAGIEFEIYTVHAHIPHVSKIDCSNTKHSVRKVRRGGRAAVLTNVARFRCVG